VSWEEWEVDDTPIFQAVEALVVSRDQAREVAAAAVAPESIGDVYSIEEIRFRTPLIYGFPEEEMAGYWIAYVESDGSLGLRASQVVLVDKSDGTVAYKGSAGDEG
jgi:hypothetical protein